MNPGDATQEWHLADAAATLALGRWLAKRLQAARASANLPQPPLLLLRGELGAGKTCLVQGLGEGLGIRERITSPTFALAQHYDTDTGPDAGTPTLVHLDLYRLEESAAADELFTQEEEEARAVGAILAVEWPERLSFQPAGAWEVDLRQAQDGQGRLALIRPPAVPAAAA